MSILIIFYKFNILGVVEFTINQESRKMNRTTGDGGGDRRRKLLQV